MCKFKGSTGDGEIIEEEMRANRREQADLVSIARALKLADINGWRHIEIQVKNIKIIDLIIGESKGKIGSRNVLIQILNLLKEFHCVYLQDHKSRRET